MLTMETPLSVDYCVPLWLRDQQVAAAIARPLPRIAPYNASSAVTRTEPIAVVCFGPSLATTWEQVRDFPYIISCSGAHKFLVERGLVPTWHVEVDPRVHKVELLGPPHAAVQYLVASTCHPKYFDHLAGHRVTLWHVFDSAAEGRRVLPPGEWALTGGSSVGLRALSIARFLGFTNLHVFGMDGCEGVTGTHAAPHVNSPKKLQDLEYEGRTYRTTPSMLHCAKETWHELDEMPDVTATFYGEGLVQAMSKTYVRTPAKQPLLGFIKPELISAEYRDLNAQMHRETVEYGVGGERHVPKVLKIADTLKTKNILDYGCGKGRLAAAIPWAIAEYDPAIPGKTDSPKPADLVVCTDVLEHIEPDKLAYVLDDLRRCVLQVGYFTIHTGAARKCLPNGQNTHLIQQNADWWKKQLKRYFQVGLCKLVGPELHVIVGPK